MYRLYDWQCTVCEFIHDDLCQVPDGELPPRQEQFTCPNCSAESTHDRLISAPAEYMGEKVCNPEVSGGACDTTGQRKLPYLPTLPSGANDMDYKYLFDKPEYKEIEAERKRINKENKQKKKRLAALKRGENINFKRDKCAGDPRI